MSSNIDQIYDRLHSDTILTGSYLGSSSGWSGLAKGGVWKQPLKRDNSGATPEAFFIGKNGKAIRPSIVVLDRGDRRHPQYLAIPGAYVGSIIIQFYGLAVQSGKDAVAAMRARVYTLLDFDASGWTFQTSDGPRAFLHLAERYGIHDSETFTEAVEDYQRYDLTSRYGNLI